jgi:hypothetical protein
MSKQGTAFLIAVAVYLSGGCAVHAPVSENIMFSKGATQTEPKKKTSVGAAVTFAPMRAIAEDMARQAYPQWDYRVEDLPINPNRFGAGLFWATYDAQKRYAFSGTVGILFVGLDGTMRVWGRSYMTVAVSWPGQVQGYVQHRLLNTASVSAAAGIGYRRDLLTFLPPCGNFCFDVETRSLHSVGARGLLFYQAVNDKQGGLQLGIYAGYAPQVKRPLIDVTLTVGVF